MKRVVFPCLVLLTICVSTSFAGTVTFLTDDEYDYSAWLENDDELYVVGGGAYEIVAKDYSYIEVQYTSTNLGIGVGGIIDIIVDDNAKLLYMNGVTEEITIYDDATAILKGGRIDYIRSFQLTNVTKHITFICDVDSVNYTGNLLTGNWLDGTSFSITLLDQSPYDSVYSNIEFIPEPASLTLLGLGGLLIRRRK